MKRDDDCDDTLDTLIAPTLESTTVRVRRGTEKHAEVVRALGTEDGKVEVTDLIVPRGICCEPGCGAAVYRKRAQRCEDHREERDRGRYRRYYEANREKWREGGRQRRAEKRASKPERPLAAP